MSEINPKINSVRIVSAGIEIARTLPKSFEIKIGFQARTRAPKNLEEKKSILNVELTIVTPEREDMKIELEADVFLSFDQIPDDYDKIMEEKCMPIARIRLFNMLDNILTDMGYQKLGLAEKE